MDLLSIQGTLNHFGDGVRANGGSLQLRHRRSLRGAASFLRLSYFPDASYRICLRPLLPLDDIKLDLIALFQTLVAVELNRAVVNKYIGSVVPTDETVTLSVVEPLDFAFILSH